MSRRIDIELTSDRGDGTWTWRAVGAKQPKGVLRGELLPDGSAIGAELRAEVEATLDGTDVIAVLPPKTKNRSAAETLELIARPLKDDELVTSKLASRGKGDRKGRGDRGDRGDRKERGRGDRGPRGDGDRRPRSDGDGRRGPSGGQDGDRSRKDRPRRDRPAAPTKPKPKRLRAGRAHRKVALDALPAAEQVIAEQVLRGGIPAVRQAVDKQNEQARAEGGREVSADSLLAIAERLLPDLRAAEWRDKAEAAVADLDELDLRDLRSVVVAAETGAKDEASRELATKLREGLAQRLDSEHAAWLAELQETLADGRVVRALRLSSRPPKAGAPLPAELASKLAEAASAALASDTMADRWATVLDALSFSPVRLTVAPASKPDAPSDELIAVITRMADRVPMVAQAFGIDPSAVPARKGRSRGGAKGKGKGAGNKPRPPKPPMPDAPSPTADAPATDTPAAEAPADAEAEAPGSDDAAAPTEVAEVAEVAEAAEAAEATEAAPAAVEEASPAPAEAAPEAAAPAVEDPSPTAEPEA